MPSSRRVLLLLPPPGQLDYPHLGMAYLARAMARAGHQVEVVDLNLELYYRATPQLHQWWSFTNYGCWCERELDKRLIELGDLLEDAVRTVADRQPEFLCLTCTTYNIGMINWLLPRLRLLLPRVTVLVGGTGVTVAKDRLQFAENTVDGFVIGDGELPLTRLLSLPRKAWSEVEGFLSVEDAATVVPLSKMVHYRTLAELEGPDFTQFDLARYSHKVLPLLLSRGCVNRCAFCNEFTFTPRFASRDPGHVAAEIAGHVRERGITNFIFNDLVLNGNPTALEGLCEALAALDLPPLGLSGQMRADGNLDAAMFKKLRAVGFHTLSFGIENLSPEVLRLMRKRITPEQIETTLTAAHGAGIHIRVNYLLGFPGETETMFLEGLEGLRKLAPHLDGLTSLSACKILPGTALERNPRRYGLVFPSIGSHGDHWLSEDFTSTPTTRNRRIESALALLSELGLVDRHLLVNWASISNNYYDRIYFLPPDRCNPGGVVRTTIPRTRAVLLAVLGNLREVLWHDLFLLDDLKGYLDEFQEAHETLPGYETATVVFPEFNFKTNTTTDHLHLMAREVGATGLHLEARGRIYLRELEVTVARSDGGGWLHLPHTLTLEKLDEVLPPASALLRFGLPEGTTLGYGEPATLELDLALTDQDGLLRLQVLPLEVQCGLLFGTNNARHELRLTGPGTFRVRVLLERCNLNAGAYEVVAELRKDETLAARALCHPLKLILTVPPRGQRHATAPGYAPCTLEGYRQHTALLNNVHSWMVRLRDPGDERERRALLARLG